MTESEAIEKLKNLRLFMQIEDEKNECKFTEDDYKAIDMAIQALEKIQQYRAIGTPEECRAAVEKQTAISREIIEGKYFCPKCHNLAPYPMYCGCGQKLY